MNNKRKFVLILASGGIDSTACINFYKKLKYNIEVIFFDYGQAASEKEFLAISAISKHYKVALRKIEIYGQTKFGGGIIQGRNAFLFFGALMNFTNENGLISSGIHHGTPYFDCSKKFIDSIKTIVDEYSLGLIKIETPFLKFSKKEIFDYCIMEKVPLELTYSCELGQNQPCNNCSTCTDLVKLYASTK